MKTLLVLVILTVLVVIAPELVTAQPPSFPTPPDQAPIDGGLTILAAAGGAYAINKLRNRKK